MNEQQVIDMLETVLSPLGSCYQEIALSLEKLGIKGYRHRCSLCPIYRYLEMKIGKEGLQEIAQYRIDNGYGDDEEVSAWYFFLFSHWQKNPCFRQVLNFISLFDNGAFHILNEVSE